ncbi:TonB-dependent receptor domain-containing protein [Spirosoma soli]|uniref:TonB-dependent receptor domain-containing protein n=1 Tax=Spirosoma soli TaxID=1770529 RepID=A0ABW5M8D9_9BACT
MNRLRNIFLFLLLAFGSHRLSAQSAEVALSGSVIDSLSRQPMPFATVALLTSGQALVETATTNTTGTFSFKKTNVGNYVLSISYIGYKNYSQPVTLTAEQTNLSIPPVLLVPANVNLSEVKVRATRPFIQQQPGKIVLNVAESILAASNSALDVLRNAPFVQVGQQGNISLKGKAVVVYIDGKQTNLSGDNLESLLTTLAAQGIDQIELISQPSARYEAAGAAVINIRTLKMRNMGLNGTVTAGVGTGRLPRSNAGLQLNYKTDRLNIYGNYDYQFNQQHYDNRSERVISSPGLVSQRIVSTEADLRRRNLNSFKAGLDYTLSKKTTVGVLLQGNYNSRNRTSQVLTQLNSAGSLPDSTVRTDNRGYAAFNNINFNANLRHTFDSTGRSLTIDADYGRFNNPWDDAIINRYEKSDAPALTEVLQLPRSQYINMSALKIGYNQPLWGGSLEAGLQTRYTETNTSFNFQRLQNDRYVTNPDLSFSYLYTEAVNSGFLNYSGRVRKVQYQAGLRLEQTSVKGVTAGDNRPNEQHYANLFPSLSMVYEPSDKSQFSLSYSSRIARPNYQSLNSAIIYESPFSYIKGNPYLKPALAHSVEIGYSFKQSLMLSLAFTSTNRAFTSLPIQQSNVTILQDQNFDRTQLVSFDVMYNKQLTPWWMTSTGFQTVYNRNVLTNLGLPTNSSLFYYAYTQNAVSLGALTKLQLTAIYIPSRTMGVYQYKPYSNVELGLQRSILNRKADVKLSVSDLFNTIIDRSEYQGPTLQLVQRNKVETRFVRLTLNYKFGNQRVRVKERKSGLDAENNRINLGK